MFKKMPVATDLSKACGDAICSLANLREIGTESARLVHCFNIRDVGTQASHLMELMKPEFGRQKRLLADMGFQAEGELVMWLPELEINRYADEHGCLFIVVGAGYKTMLCEIFLGGTARAALSVRFFSAAQAAR